METIVSFIMNSAEAQKLGMNAPTFWALGAGLLTFVQAYGSYKLIFSIYNQKSGMGLSLYMLGYWHALMWCLLYYSVHANSVTIMFNGMVLAPLYSVALFLILKYDGFLKIRSMKIAVPLLVMPVLFVFIPRKDVVLLIFMTFGLFFFIDQARLLYVEKIIGSFDPRYTVGVLVASVFWSFFAFSLNDIALIIINPLIAGISLMTLHAYVRAKNMKHQVYFINSCA